MGAPRKYGQRLPCGHADANYNRNKDGDCVTCKRLAKRAAVVAVPVAAFEFDPLPPARPPKRHRPKKRKAATLAFPALPSEHQDPNGGRSYLRFPPKQRSA